jgi:hypothetical protein
LLVAPASAAFDGAGFAVSDAPLPDFLPSSDFALSSDFPASDFAASAFAAPDFAPSSDVVVPSSDERDPLDALARRSFFAQPEPL